MKKPFKNSDRKSELSWRLFYCLVKSSSERHPCI